MAVASAEVVPYSLPFKEPYVTARGSLDRREMVLLRVRGDDGTEGLGEAVPLSLRGGAGLDAVAGELRSWADAPGLPPDALSAPARCAVLTALLDLEGRQKAVPAWRLLGAERVAPVRCNATLTGGEPLHVAQQALAWEAAGFRSFKLKLGGDAGAETVRMVRQAVGPDAKIRVDANGVWDLATARETLAEIEELGIELAEQPVSTLEEMAELRGETSIAIAADESVATPEEAEAAARSGACDLATVKLSKTGDPDPRPIAAHLPVYLSSALDGPVGIAAAAHAAQLLETPLAHGLATQRLFADRIATAACDLRGDLLHPPEGPGLGVELDEGALERRRL
jgi:L-alanine-DL-glutamate epimerase-like enolase superfamily enzyme